MKRLAAIIALIILNIASASAQNTVEEIVARVNNEIILKSELDRSLKELRDALGQEGGLTGARLEQEFTARSKDALRDLIDQSLLLQVAKDQGLTADIEVIKTMEKMRQEYKFETLDALERAIVQQGGDVDDFKNNIKTRYLTSQVIGREVRVPVPTTEEIRSYYESHKQEFDRPAGVQLEEISVFTQGKTPEQAAEQRKKIDDALTAVKGGENFNDVAARVSESTTAQDGGFLGFFPKGQLNEELATIVTPMAKGQVSDVIPRPDGFMILKLADKHEGGLLSFDLAQSEISNKFYSERQGPKIREYLTKLRAEGFVEVRDGYVDTGAPQKAQKAAQAQ
jgi:peptidyl-prolyl cis-trans isomerase SurA